jgi:putative protease
MWKPEVLAPAGGLERLKIACLYGADAVYVGGQKYGMRARADNFTLHELHRGVEFAHALGAKVYVVLNAFLHDEDFEGLPEFCRYLESIAVDAVIVSDLGVVREVLAACKVPVHLSTQASCLNASGARLWKKLGIDRVIVGRELTIEETGQIGQEVGVEVEMFVHGALCMAYSGNCTISNFTAGRDSNRGGCIQSCRFSYDQVPKPDVKGSLAMASGCSSNAEEGAKVNSHFMSSRDLLGIRYIPQFFQSRISSLKIEGRMKSALYVAGTAKTYKNLVLAYAAGDLTEERLEQATKELLTLPHRDGFDASLDEPAGSDSIYNPEPNSMPRGTHQFAGIVVDVDDSWVSIKTFAPIFEGTEIELLPFVGETRRVVVESLHGVDGCASSQVRQESVARIRRSTAWGTVEPLQVVRSPSEFGVDVPQRRAE